MKEETKEDLDKKFEKEQELRFWETIFESTSLTLIHHDREKGVNRTPSDVASRAASMASAAVDERRRFLRNQ